MQGELERAIREIVGKPVRLVGAGRTDAGVHATGQVASFTTESRLTPREWVAALNGHLPPSVAVRHAWDAPSGFHARFDATARSYRYSILNRPIRPALGRQYRWHVSSPLDGEAMSQALGALVGEHDFTSFAGASVDRRGKGNVRRMLSATCIRVDDELHVDVTADAFLPHMVRNIVGTLVPIGRGGLMPERMSEILGARDRSLAGPTAPPEGLCLVRVHYGDTIYGEPQDPRRQGV